MEEASRQFLAELQNKLNQYFSGEEIETLAFVLGVDYEALRGDAKPTKINAFILDVARNGRVEQLLAEVRRQRGNVLWPTPPDNLTLPQAGEVAGGATVYNIGSLHTSGGSFIGGGVNAGGNVQVGQKNIGGDEIKGNQYNMSGDFRGAILNIESKLDFVSRSLSSLPAAAPDQREQLARLIDELKVVLGGVSPEQLPDAEALTRRMGALAEEATAKQPDRAMVMELSEIAQRAASKLGSVMPNVMSLVASIIELVAALVK
jgi:hypothetical protein